MATSGSFNGNEVVISSPYYGYIWTQWQLASQNDAGNYSTINWQTYFHFYGCDAQLNAGSTGSNVGTLWSNGGLVHSYGGDFTTRDILLASGSFNIGADGSGNTTLDLNSAISVYESGESSGSGSWGYRLFHATLMLLLSMLGLRLTQSLRCTLIPMLMPILASR